ERTAGRGRNSCDLTTPATSAASSNAHQSHATKKLRESIPLSVFSHSYLNLNLNNSPNSLRGFPHPTVTGCKRCEACRHEYWAATKRPPTNRSSLPRNSVFQPPRCGKQASAEAPVRTAPNFSVWIS